MLLARLAEGKSELALSNGIDFASWKHDATLRAPGIIRINRVRRWVCFRGQLAIESCGHIACWNGLATRERCYE
jgi:hypothetical protein